MLVYSHRDIGIKFDPSFLFLFNVYSKIGEEQSPEDAEDGPPELLVGPVEAC